ncbi:MAG: hypothetical protein C0392_16100 [Syntrophus sp. (in: bacteria)]|nr:hypothetical protein [Syntrophus sp. (in: bacteria)]
MARKKATTKLPPFVPMTWKMLNHKACTSLPPTAGQMLPYFLGKVKLRITDPGYYHAEFTFTYTEAERLGCSRRSFYRVIISLMGHGFIDPISKGGRRGGADTESVFRLSKRWEKFGFANFEDVQWRTFGKSQIQRQVAFCLCPVAKKLPGKSCEESKQCQKDTEQICQSN